MMSEPASTAESLFEFITRNHEASEAYSAMLLAIGRAGSPDSERMAMDEGGRALLAIANAERRIFPRAWDGRDPRRGS